VISIFVDMGGARNSLEVYVADFEEALLGGTREFYRVQSASWTEQDSFPDYMAKAEDRLQQEVRAGRARGRARQGRGCARALGVREGSRQGTETAADRDSGSALTHALTR
jgi:hypothetical protein